MLVDEDGGQEEERRRHAHIHGVGRALLPLAMERACTCPGDGQRRQQGDSHGRDFSEDSIPKIAFF
jgi:hypothetical protein